MKKFSSLKEEVKPKYELKDSLRNQIYSILENTLSIKISNEESIDKDINVEGKEELVEKIKILVDNVRVKERTLTLETVKANVHRNFDMRWLTEQIDSLKKIKIENKFELSENIQEIQDVPVQVQGAQVQGLQAQDIEEDIQDQDTQVQDVQVQTQVQGESNEVINYFVKKLNEDKKFGDFEFDFEPSEGIFQFVNESDGVVVRATPFYNDDSGFPIEVFDEHQIDTHIFIEQREFDTNSILFEKYKEIMEKFLIDDVDEWMTKVDKFDSEKE